LENAGAMHTMLKNVCFFQSWTLVNIFDNAPICYVEKSNIVWESRFSCK